MFQRTATPDCVLVKHTFSTGEEWWRKQDVCEPGEINRVSVAYCPGHKGPWFPCDWYDVPLEAQRLLNQRAAEPSP